MTIEYTLNGLDKSLEANVPEKIYLRHNLADGSINEAATSSDHYLNDPRDQHSYSEFVSESDPIVAFYIWKAYRLSGEEVDQFIDEYAEILKHKRLDVIHKDGETTIINQDYVVEIQTGQA